MTQPRRDWRDARAAKANQGCRVCGRWDPTVELAHTLGREFDRRKPSNKTRYVHPHSVVPLCGPAVNTGTCHNRFDSHELDLWPHLTPAERVWAIGRVGEGAARRRISGRNFVVHPSIDAGQGGHEPLEDVAEAGW